MSDLKKENAGPVKTCPGCQQKVDRDEMMACDDCNKLICADCVVQKDGEVLCKTCAKADRKNASCQHPSDKVEWSGQWLRQGVGRPDAMKGVCKACGATVLTVWGDPHAKIPSQNPYHRNNGLDRGVAKYGGSK